MKTGVATNASGKISGMLRRRRLKMNDAITTTGLAIKDDPMVAAAGRPEVSGGAPLSAEPSVTTVAKAGPVQIVLMMLGVIAFLYFARPVLLPVFLAGVAGMVLKPLVRWLSRCHIPPALSATPNSE